MLRRLPWLSVVLLFLAAPVQAQEGRLAQIRHDVTASSPDNSKNDSCSSADDGPFKDLLGELLVPVVCYTAAAPFVVPRALLHDAGKVDAAFLWYPYADHFPGGLWLGRPPVCATEEKYIPPTKADIGDWWTIRLSAEYGTDFGDIQRVGARLFLDTQSRFGLLSEWNYYRESLPCGCVDETVIGTTNLTYRFAQHEVVQMDVGAGFRVLTDPYLTRWGFNFHYGADLFPMEPMVISSEVDLGNVGHAFALHVRASLGVTWKHGEVFTGYDFLRIGSTNLQGPMTGVRFWF
jgi:hypothetical protein